MKKLLLSFALLSIAFSSFGQLITPFSVRYSVTQKGGIVIIGNTASGCGTGTTCTGGSCATAHAEAAPGGVGVDNDFIQTYIDIDGNATTFMSSSDSLNLPTCSQISFAGLYWSAGGPIGDPDGINWPTRTQINLKVNSGTYQPLTADVSQDNNIGYKSYNCFTDITSIVSTAGPKGRYTLANMPLLNDNGTTQNRWGGWAIVVVYKNDLQALRNLTVFNGLTSVSSTNTTTDVPISGFLTPPTGPINFELGLVTYDGDRGAAAAGACAVTYKGDSLLFKGAGTFKSISDAIHPANDVFNSTIASNGILTPFRNPSYKNTLGFDANIFFPNNATKSYIGNSATSAIIRQRTGGETYLTQVVTSAIDVFEPDLRGGLSVIDVNGGTLQSGDTLEYTAVIKNIGSNPSKNTFIVDTFATHSDYVPGSIKITYGPNSGNKTDALGDDQAEYFPGSRSIKVRIGTGATAAIGGQLVESPSGVDSTQVKFRVTATNDCMLILCNNIIDNSFRVIGTGFVSNNTFDHGSNPDIFDANGCPIAGSTSSNLSPITCTPPTASNNSPVCIGGTINLFVQPSATATYSWTGPNGFTSSVQNPSITGATALMAGPYTVTINVSVGGSTCTFTATSTSVIVSPTPTVTSSNSATICSGSTVNIPLTGSSTTGFTWIAADNAFTTGESITSQGTATLNNTIVNTTGVPQTVTYTVTPLGGCAGNPQTVTVIVNPTPTATSSGTATICSGSTASIALTSSIPSTFSWIAANNANTTGESLTSQSTSTLSNTIINSTSIPQTVIYTVIPTSTAGGCATLTPQTVTVTVNPAPNVTSSASAIICSGNGPGITLTSSIPSSFSWIASDNSNTTGESLTAQSTSTLNDSIINASTVAQIVTYIVTPTSTAGGCATLSPQSVTVTVNPAPTVTSSGTATICSGTTISLPLTSSIPSTFSWIAADNSNTTGESLTQQFTSTLSNTIINSTSTPQTVVYTVIPTDISNGCVILTPEIVTVTVNPSAVANGGSDATICSGNNYTLSGSIGGGASSLTWSTTGTGTFDDSTLSSATYTPSILDITNGIVTMVLSTNDPVGVCQQTTDSILLMITPRDITTFSYGGSTFCSSGTNPTPTITGLAGGTFSSSSPLLLINPSTGTINMAGSSLGTYSITYTTNGPCPDSSIVSFTVTNAPSASMSFTGATYCQNSTPNPLPTFTSSGSGGVFSSTPGLVIDSISGQVNLTTSIPGTYVVTNFIAASGGCAVASASSSITITPLDSAGFNYTSAAFCQTPTAENPIITGLTGGSFSSSPAGLFIDPVTGQITLTGSLPATYAITYQTAGACPNTSAVNVSINPLPIAAAGIAQTINCGADSISLNGIGSSTGASINYLWSTSDGNLLSGINSLNPSINQPGTYMLLVSDSSGCSSSSSVSITTSTNLPIAAFLTTPSPATGTVPLLVDLLNTSMYSNTYIWDFGNGSPVSSVTDPNYIYTVPGTYNIILIASNNGMCPDTTQITVVVNVDDFLFIPEGFSPNGDGSNDDFVITGIENYPNNEFVIFNRWGNIVHKAKPYENKWDGRATEGLRVGGDQLPVSTYFYVLDLGNGSKPIKGYIYLNR